jgi:hypothetical protein
VGEGDVGSCARALDERTRLKWGKHNERGGGAAYRVRLR